MVMNIFSRPFGWYWYALLLTLWLCNYAVVQGDGGAWRIDATSTSIANYSTGVGQREYSEFFGSTLWFRHVKRLGALPLPNTVEPRVVDMQIITRAEDPPASITLRSATHTIPLPTTPHHYHIHLYIPADTQYIVECNNSDVTVAYLQNICMAFVSALGEQPLQGRSDVEAGYILPIIAWMGLVVVALHASRAPSTTSWVLVSVAGAMVLMLLEKYNLQIVSWRYGILNLFGAAMILIWGSERLRFRTRQTVILLVMALVLKVSGSIAPGAPAIDVPVHAQQLENVMRGNLYLQNSGTLNPVAGNKAITQTYPYPPSIYLLLAPIALLFQPPFTLDAVVGMSTMLLDALFVLGLIWLVHSNRLSHRVAVLTSMVYLFFPQSYVLQNYPNTAQALAQAAGWIFLVVAAALPHPRGLNQRIGLSLLALLSVAGHFGVFITMSVVQAFAFVMGGLRRTVVYWVVTGAVVTALYYSQYVALILDQVNRLDNQTQLTWIQDFTLLWQKGINDHYSGVVFVVGTLALGLTTLRTRPLLRQLWWSAYATAVVLGVLRIAFDINPTRFVIMLSPLIALGLGLLAHRYMRSRAGRWLVYFFFISQALIGIMTWYTLKIDHDMIRWSLPQ
jgi:hypothetical protein